MIEKILNKNNISTKDKVESVQWKTQDTKKNALLFYKFNNRSQEEIDLFNKRIKDISYAAIVTNFFSDNQNYIYSFDEDIFDEIQNEALQSLYPLGKNKCIIGITGTNGKTTCTDLIRQILVYKNKKVLSIGTLGVYLGDEKQDDFSLTTPSKIDLHKTLYRFQSDFDIAVMEVSSHALEQNRLATIKLNYAGWTNFTQDHLDYHKTMDAYFEAKKKILNLVEDNSKLYVPRSQDEIISKIPNVSLCEEFEVPKNNFFKARYNQENLFLSVSILKNIIEIDLNELDFLSPPEGRFGVYSYKDNLIVIDFAHTPDALKSILNEIKSSFAEYTIHTLFGCGGDRDKSKRSEMGNIASELSDYIYITSDNPRFEDPQAIINDIKKGVNGDFYENTDRSEAIKYAFSKISKAVLLIAGKGHEAYIDIKGKKYDYSDHKVVTELIDDN